MFMKLAVKACEDKNKHIGRVFSCALCAEFFCYVLLVTLNGLCSTSGPPGDLFVYLDIEEIPEIQRDGINLYSSVSISYLDAILGTVIEVKTVEGMTKLQIPQGSQPGDVLVLARKGAPKLNRPSIRGDHFFTVKVSIPKRISAKERELLEELSSLANAPAIRSNTLPKVQQPVESTASETVSVEEKNDESADQKDLWKKLTDFAGSVVDGALKWFKDNI